MNERPDTTAPLKITVVTPNYNGAALLEETILSVVSQNYPNLEYILVDGASTDDSMSIVERHAHHFAQIICEKDQGHADALNKGFSRATGDVMAWINSDDLLLPGSLHRVNQVFSTFPQVAWLTGRPVTASESGQLDSSRPLRMWSWIRFLCGDFRHIQQESTFWRRSLWQAAGASLDTRYRLANDFELWLRFFRRATLFTIDAPLGCFRFRAGQRSIAHAADYERECEQALDAFIDVIPAALLARYFHLMPSEQLRSRGDKPTALPSGLAATDPPLITVESGTGNLNMADFNNRDIPGDFKPDVSIEEDMFFDGLDRVVWSAGPQFAQHDLAAVEIELVPFAPDMIASGGLSETSPPTVALIGPLAVSDRGGGKMTLQIHFRDGVASHDLELAEAGRHYRIKLLLSADRYALFLDGHNVAVESTKGPQVMQSRFAVLGGGDAQRFWVGAVQQVAVTLSARAQEGNNGDQALTTYLLAHLSDTRVLPRERRDQWPPVKVGATNPAERPTPLTEFRNRHRGQRCFVMGNGPSLNKMDLEKLAGEIVFACNAAFLLFERVSWRPTYYTCVDTRVIRDRAADIRAMLDEYTGITAFFPVSIHLHDGSGTVYQSREIIPPGANRYYFNEVGNRESNHPETMFSLDADDYVVQPYTVAITMLQLAAFMGFSEIYLIGCDTSYKVQETVKQEGREINGVGLLLTSTRDDDANHFDPRYFGQGREWHNPQVHKMLNHYRWAQLALRRTNTRVFNATVGGQLEVFPRVDFNAVIPQERPVAATGRAPARGRPLLSIAIPAYDRPDALMYAVERFVQQISGRFEDEVEIVVSDDCSPNDSLKPVRMLAARHDFLRYRRYETNIGLERNLLACAEGCYGEYLWIFGDDDFLATDDALEDILHTLRESRFDVIVLNRARMNTDLSQVLTPNWMELDPALRQAYPGLREFCLEFGFISIIGFISVNIFRNRLFQRIDSKKYMGTMYPQLGALLEAFFDRRTLLIGKPLVCHRTQTAEEKRQALGAKLSEADFMADYRKRNAVYFSHPYMAMLDELIRRGAFSREDVMLFKENTVINGYLIDFLLASLRLSDEMHTATYKQWARTNEILASLPLDPERRAKIAPVIARHKNAFAHLASTLGDDIRRFIASVRGRAITPAVAQVRNALSDSAVTQSGGIQQLTISVITPSFNQAKFLPDCLRSVRNQTYAALEQLVFDPGSKDASREIAAGFEHATLFAEPDSGQSDALNKGFQRARGDIVAWLNSDDMLIDNRVFERVVARFLEPDAPDIVYGKGIYIDEAGAKLRNANINKDPSTLPWRLRQESGIMQPALFMRRSVIERVGPLRNDLHFSMDYEYWIRCVKAGIKFVYIDQDIAAARYHLSNKTYGQRGESYAEVCRMTKEHFGFVHHIWLRRYAEFLTDKHDGVLKNLGNSGVKNEARLRMTYRKLLHEYNGDTPTLQFLSARAGERGVGETYRQMKWLGLLAPNGRQYPTLRPSQLLYGPFDRSMSAHYDETDCVAEIYSKVRVGNVMIDVGAHFGAALFPFLNRGWSIFAFEPDEQNRARLLERLSGHRNKELVTLDTRCVSNKSEHGVSFFRSEQSTGISGLSAFHETHVEAQKVDTVSLAEFFEGKPMPEVDFLKIDTEGHDLFVLQGFPWDRCAPAVVQCEFEDGKTVALGYTVHDLAEFLLEKGYTVYVSEWHPIVRYGMRHDWNRLARYPCELANAKGWGNLLAFRDPVDERDLVAAVRKVLDIRRSLLVRQFVMRGMRLLKRHAAPALLAGILLAVLIAAPLVVPALAMYEGYFWFAGALLAVIAATALGALLVRRNVLASVQTMIDQQFSAKRALKSELPREIRQPEDRHSDNRSLPDQQGREE